MASQACKQNPFCQALPGRRAAVDALQCRLCVAPTPTSLAAPGWQQFAGLPVCMWWFACLLPSKLGAVAFFLLAHTECLVWSILFCMDRGHASRACFSAKAGHTVCDSRHAEDSSCTLLLCKQSGYQALQQCRNTLSCCQQQGMQTVCTGGGGCCAAQSQQCWLVAGCVCEEGRSGLQSVLTVCAPGGCLVSMHHCVQCHRLMHLSGCQAQLSGLCNQGS